MDLLYDLYYSQKNKNEIDVHSLTHIIETYSQINQTVDFFNHKVEPLDHQRNFNNKYNKQRLKVHLHQSIPKGQDHCDYHGILDDITGILSLVTCRIFLPTENIILNIENQDKIVEEDDYKYKSHPNLTFPVQQKDLNRDVDSILSKLYNINNDKDVQKFRVIQKAIKLYRDSLFISIYDIDTAYILLITAAEVLGSEFSKVNPQITDINDYDKIRKLIDEYKIDDQFLAALTKILFKPRHMKLQVKFIDIIQNNIGKDFFKNKPLVYNIVGKPTNNKENLIQTIDVLEREASFYMREDQLIDALKNLYISRSKFVHAGCEWPKYVNCADLDLIQPIETDESGKGKRNKDGSFKLKKPIPSYFWFERVMNDVLMNIIEKFGNREL